MTNKISNFFSYHTEKMGFFQNCYNINSISIKKNDIVIHYNNANGLSSSTKTESARNLLDQRDQFNRIDKLKIDACNLSKDLIDIIALLDVDEKTKTAILSEFTQRISQYLGIDR